MGKSVLITGGLGFIGFNTALYFGRRGFNVLILDNLSRVGAKDKLDSAKQLGLKFEFFKNDIRDLDSLKNIVGKNKPSILLHLAGQVAVTSSVKDPVFDFQVNAMGSFNVLEAVRNCSPETIVFNSSTNKVYGSLKQLKIKESQTRFELKDYPNGVPEHVNLDFHSPYGCSKGCADQYFIDYARIYGLKTCVFRQSCIYGQNQFGIEDQGWVAWFFIAASVLNKQLTVYGNGKQVRDILHVDDLTELYYTAFDKIEKVNGNAYNIGGGRNNSISLVELISFMKDELKVDFKYGFADARSGDQKVYISDLSSIQNAVGWSPRIDKDAGLKKMYSWVVDNTD
ncbi:MAG: GDP-mannose 4,6-dehydratase, partial [Planctomycetes bacterium]|nr:GDP-mannose 4,6-dehydratase [Planctomycetota bacterium]